MHHHRVGDHAATALVAATVQHACVLTTPTTLAAMPEADAHEAEANGPLLPSERPVRDTSRVKRLAGAARQSAAHVLSLPAVGGTTR